MAVTSLEAIAQQIEQEKQKKLNDILNVSGSAAMVKNDYNVTIVDESNAASSLIFKPLTKEKYDTTELLKAVDVNVKELVPNIPVANLNLVPKPLYDTEVSTSIDLKNQVESLNVTITDLNSQISNLQSQIQFEIQNKLIVEQTNDIVVNQLDTVGNSVNQFASQIATSLQKSVDESILRASLQAQNTGFKSQIQALIKQIDSLNSIIEGLQAQLGAVQQQQTISSAAASAAASSGATVINKVLLAKITKSDDKTQADIYGKISAKGGNKWINGESISLTNSDVNPITVSITQNLQPVAWLRVSQNNLTLQPNQNITISLTMDENATANIDSKGGKSYSHTASYKGSTINISCTRLDNTVDSKSFTASFDKCHPSSY
jgi:hypothetical protein